MRFFLVDRVDEIEPGKFIRGIKNIAYSEDVLQDHFPENPIFPGTMVVEAMAQLGGCLVECSFNSEAQNIRRAILAQIEKAKFYQPSMPGDQLVMRCELLSTLENAAQVRGEARIDGELAARATLTFVLREVDSEKVHQQRREIYKIWMRKLPVKIKIQ